MNLKARTGVLAGAATVALLALPGIASANVTSAFDAATGALTVTSDAGDPIAITCVAGDVKITDGTGTTNPGGGMGTVDCADVKSITVTGGPGENAIDLEAVTAADFSALTSVLVNGGDGSDAIDGSQLSDRLVGQRQNDTVAGHGGNDTIVWNGGEGDDINDGGDGVDTIEVNGSPTAGETFAVKPDAAQPGRVRFDRVAPPTPTPPGGFLLDIGTAEVLDLNMNGGDDTVTADAGLDALGFSLDVDGGAGNDTIDGSDAADVLKGGPDNDTITPDDNPAGTFDDARGDAGNDTIIWNGGDDNDRNDGGEGDDTSLVNGAAANETFTVKPGAAGHVVFDRTSTNPQAFTVDMTTTERLRLLMNAGDDAITADGGIAPFSLDVDGGPGIDSIDGGDGADTLDGGDDNDTIVPDDNPAGTKDVARGGNGDDTIVWNGGDDDDVNDGGDGNDTSVINGAPLPERFTIKPGATAGRVQFDRTSANPGPFSVDIGTTELLRLNANDGDDVIKGFKGLSGLIRTELNGEGDDDRIRGTDAEDRINAGKGRDIVDSVDRAEDLLDCGTGLDLAFVDRRDFVRNCNIVIGGLRHVTAPKRAVVSDTGVAALRLKCAGTKKCKGVARLRKGGKTLGSARFTIRSGKKTVHLELNRKGRALMAKSGAKHRVKLQLDAKDGDGNGWRSTSRLTLR
ncbi:MAG TPA: calcium-binding protein [Solirubrobacteraceae bacterium]|nr:calcium-binding protein [Solirubrobacteraceae bacterium]